MNCLYELLDSSTTFCTHEHGCIISALKQAFKNLKYGLIISGVLQLIRSIKMCIQNPSNLKKSIKIQFLSITLYLCATALTLKLVRCALRHIRDKDDGFNSLIAGGTAGWVASKTLSKDYWYFYLCLIGSRLIGVIHKRLISIGWLKEENTHLHSYAMMTLAHGIHMYGYFLHPFILKNDVNSLYNKMSVLTVDDQKTTQAYRRYFYRRIQ